MRAKVNIKPLVNAIAFIALAGVLLATAIALNDTRVSSMRSKDEPPAAIFGALDAEFARCKAIGAEAANDPVCKAVWEDNRKRFFKSEKLPISMSPAQAPKDTPQSPTTPNANSSPPSGDSPGARAR
jgi:conjugative transfer region protein TrbK